MSLSKWIGWPVAAVFLVNALIISSVNAFQDTPGAPGSPGAPGGEMVEDGDKKPDRRNPRQIRRDSGVPGPPRMVGGGMSMDGNDTLGFYKKLESLIGTFTIEGKSWRRPDSEPVLFTGEWENKWAFDGHYMQTDFMIPDLGRRSYFAMGMTYYNGRTHRYEADFYNSNGALRTARYGNFDEDEKIMTMMSRNSSQAPDDKPKFKVIIEIVDESKFIYSGWQQATEEDKWWNSYEMTMTRSDLDKEETVAGG